MEVVGVGLLLTSRAGPVIKARPHACIHVVCNFKLFFALQKLVFGLPLKPEGPEKYFDIKWSQNIHFKVVYVL